MYVWSQLGGTFPAPLFLFLAGISIALISDKHHQKGISYGKSARIIIRRGLEIVALGLLFRLQEYVIAWGWAPWTDLLRVDILNQIGLSIMLLGAASWMVRSIYRGSRAQIAMTVVSSLIAIFISLLTPLIWTSLRPTSLPWPLESYIDGVHNLGQPQAWLFPIFPWTGFAFAGLAMGSILLSEWVRTLGAWFFATVFVAGAGLSLLGRTLERGPYHLYAVDDFWHTSPDFFMIRVGLILIILSASYAWCKWGPGQWGFSPLIRLGQTSLLVYWIHIEFVYGRFSIVSKRAANIRDASLGLALIFVTMLVVSVGRARFRIKQPLATN